jgi:transposase
MDAYSVDLRVRIVQAHLAHEGSQAVLAECFKVSERWLRKLLRQHCQTGSLEPLPHGRSRRTRTRKRELL